MITWAKQYQLLTLAIYPLYMEVDSSFKSETRLMLLQNVAEASHIKVPQMILSGLMLLAKEQEAFQDSLIATNSGLKAGT